MNTSSKSEADIQSTGFIHRLQLVSLIAIIAGLCYVLIVLMGSAFLQNLSNLESNNIYVAFSSWDVPSFVAAPCLLSLGAILVLRLFDKANENNVNLLLKVALYFAAPAIIVRVFYGFYVSSLMEENGYSECWYYTSPALVSPNVWVREPGYCVENTGVIRNEVLDWMDSLSFEEQRDISYQEVQVHVNQMLADWNQAQREKYPHLYED